MAETDSAVSALLQLGRGGAGRVGAERVRLLEAVRDHGQIAAAAKSAGLSYRGAWDAVQALNNLFEQPLVVARPGGQAGGGAVVTPAGDAVIAAFRSLEEELSRMAGRLQNSLAGHALNQLAWSLTMKTSARNAFRGVVEQVVEGAVSAEVTLRVSASVAIVAIITKDSVRDLDLAPGREAVALIKSSFVILAPGETPPRTSARNSLSGVVIRREHGAVNDEIVLEIAEGKTLTATVTSASAETLGLDVGKPATAIIKASHVILAVD